MNRNGEWITDSEGRILILRGVNAGGSSKLPLEAVPPGAGGSTDGDTGGTEKPEDVSFAGRPFPPEEAGAHFARLKSRGFTFVRLLVTWEALEHSGPGIYDEAYLAYLRKLLLAAEKAGVSVLLDPHQDVWSRWTGGDGAPAWTLEKLGMDLPRLVAAGAVLTGKDGGEGKTRPQMVWPVNYSLYAAATMFTLFFAGRAFAPQCNIEGENAQDWLQERYIAAFRHCFRRLKNCRALAGWGVMNEPHPGFIAYRDLRSLENAVLYLGPLPSAFQAMAAASGHCVEVPVYTPWLKGGKITGKKTINPGRLPLFKEGYTCPWKEAGVWTDKENGGTGEARLLKPDHFSRYGGRPARFCDDFLKPFTLRFIERMNQAERPVLFFIEGVPHREHPSWSKEDPQNTVHAFHHYDSLTLFTKRFRSWLTADTVTGKVIIGKKKTAAHYSAKLAEAKLWTREKMENMPCLLGEFGLPFDLDRKKAYKTGDYGKHEKALSLYYNAVDENLLGSAIWNYTADNTNEDGDHWNGEDLSIIAHGKERAVRGWLRPYPAATAGTPLRFCWNGKTVLFRFRAESEIEAPTEIFLPARWFPEEPVVTLKKLFPSDNVPVTEYRGEEQRLLVYNKGFGGEIELTITAG